MILLDQILLPATVSGSVIPTNKAVSVLPISFMMVEQGFTVYPSRKSLSAFREHLPHPNSCWMSGRSFRDVLFILVLNHLSLPKPWNIPKLELLAPKTLVLDTKRKAASYLQEQSLGRCCLKVRWWSHLILRLQLIQVSQSRVWFCLLFVLDNDWNHLLSFLSEGGVQLKMADLAPPKEKVVPIPEGSAFFCLSKTNP